jgi:CheY-like chemotaxis protein
MNARPAVMIVDDDADDRYALEATLEPLGVEIVRASDGEEALRRLLERDVSVIVMDLLMPRLNGFETAALIRGRDRFASLPIIFLTGFDSDGLRHVPGYHAGDYEFLTKPVLPEALRARVRDCVARAPAGGA